MVLLFSRDSNFLRHRFPTWLCLALALAITNSEPLQAQDFSLRNYRAVKSADDAFNLRQGSRLRLSRSVARNYRHEENLAEQVKPDTADELLNRNREDSYEYISYRGLAYLSYLNDVFDTSVVQDFEQSQAAEKTFVFETLRVANEYVIRPNLGSYYDLVVVKLKRVRNYTTFRVVRDEQEGLGVQRGASDDERLLEFKIHASARYGVEPRLIFSDRLVLRYQPLESETWIEYRYSF